MYDTVQPFRALVRLAFVVGLVGIALTGGCDPEGVSASGRRTFGSLHRMVVLPLTDGPSPGAKGSGQVVRGVVMRELHQMGRFEIINVSHEQLLTALDETGYDVQDCYDPYVAAAVGKEFNADAVVCGELTHFGTRQESRSTTVMVVQSGGTQTHHYVGVSLRLVKTDTAVILYSGLGDGFAREGYTSAAAVACKQAIDPLRRYYQQIK